MRVWAFYQDIFSFMSSCEWKRDGDPCNWIHWLWKYFLVQNRTILSLLRVRFCCNPREFCTAHPIREEFHTSCFPCSILLKIAERIFSPQICTRLGMKIGNVWIFLSCFAFISLQWTNQNKSFTYSIYRERARDSISFYSRGWFYPFSPTLFVLSTNSPSSKFVVFPLSFRLGNSHHKLIKSWLGQSTALIDETGFIIVHLCGLPNSRRYEPGGKKVAQWLAAKLYARPVLRSE